MRRSLDVLLATLALALCACATSPVVGQPSTSPSSIDAVVVHPIFDTWFVTNEHWAGQFGDVGDALGADCIVAELVEEDGRTWMRSWRGDGSRNEDW
ncbi:MAG TPA: hypothetical protein VGD74_01430, partial [Vulgatibacter sp.]